MIKHERNYAPTCMKDGFIVEYAINTNCGWRWEVKNRKRPVKTRKKWNEFERFF